MVGPVEWQMRWLILGGDLDRGMARQFGIALEQNRFAAGGFDPLQELVLCRCRIQAIVSRNHD
jgi:hypothetical protein